MNRGPQGPETIFGEAIDIAAADERAAYLDQACENDLELRVAVEQLVVNHFRAGKFLDKPAAQFAATINTPGESPIGEMPGTVIGPYKLLQQIGEGGMGTVYMAEQTHPVQRKVALKVIKAGMDSQQVIARFEAERQALAMMDHVNIARVLDAGTTESGLPYFVMELVHGVPITKYCDDNHLTPRQRLEQFVPVCQAIQHAHQKGIIHRDIKPSNVMVTLYDGKPVPKVIDFGVAKATEQKLTERTLFTQYGTMVGTLEYMSPEQAEMSALGIDTRSDIYSLGVLLYELLTGNTPLSHKTMKEAAYAEILRLIKEEEPPKPSTRLSDSGEALASISANRHTEPAKLTKLVRGELDWIVMKTLEKDRNRRYETANGLAVDVQRYLDDETVQACPPSAGYRFRKFARRNKAAIAVAGLVLFFLVLLGSGAGWAMRDRNAREQEAVRDQAAREAKVAGQVESIIAEVDRMEKDQKCAEALAAARRAEAAVAGGEADAETAERVRARLKDLEFIDRLEQIRMQRATLVDGKFDYAGADREYARAFRDYGVDPLELAVETSIDRLKGRPALAIPLAAALDDWVDTRRVDSTVEVAGWKRLVAVARGIDPEPLRDRLRSTWGEPVSEVQNEVRRLADSIDSRAQHPATLVSLARTLQRATHPDSALRILRNAQYIYPGDFWLNFELGSALHTQKDYEGAIRFYTAAVSIRPNSAAAHNNLGGALRSQALRDQKEQDEAIAAFRKAIEVDPKYAAAYSNLGVALRGQKKLDEAIAAYRKAIEIDPKNALVRSYLGEAFPTHNMLGDALLEKGDVDGAIAAFKEAIRLKPDFTGSHYSLGTILRDSKHDYDGAIAWFNKAIELDPKNATFHCELGGTLRIQGKLDEAVAAYRKAIEVAPKNGQAHHILGHALRAKGDVDGAITCYRKAIEFFPNVVAFHTSLASALRQQGKLDEAIAAFKEIIRLKPDLANGHSFLGAILRDNKHEYEGAIACFSKAIELDPKNPTFHDDLGVALERQGKLDEAIAAFRKAIELAPKAVAYHINLGSALERQGKLDEATGAFRKAIELDAKNVWAYNNLGVALGKQGKWDEAIAIYRKVIELDPKFISAHIGLGVALEQQQKWDEAIALYCKVLELDAKNVWGYYRLGVALGKQGKLDEAIAAFEEASRLQPGNATVHFELASALAQAKQWDRSASVYAEALQQSGAPLWPGPWYAAIRSEELFTRLTALRPDDRLPWIMRARLHALQRDWKRAAADYARVNESWASIDQAKLLGEGDDLLGYACLLLLVGDRPGYEQFCKKWADRVGDAQGWEYSLARTWAVSPRSVVPSQQIVEWARKTVQARRQPWDLHVLSLAHYRNGEFDLAIEHAKESNAGYWGGSANALNWLVLAMAHHRLGQAAEARTSLEQALQLASRASPEQPPGVEWPDMAPSHLLEFELLRREATDLIDTKSTENPEKDKR